MNFEIQTSSYSCVVILLLLYDKADASSIKMNVVRKIIKDIGLDLEKLQTEGKLKLPQKE